LIADQSIDNRFAGPQLLAGGLEFPGTQPLRRFRGPQDRMEVSLR
jgi:hypothetical protein